VSGGATIPVTVFANVGPTVSTSRDVTNTQEVIYNEWLGAQQSAALADNGAPAPIADLLIAVRNGLIDASRRTVPPKPANGPQACFTAHSPTKPGDDPGDSIKIAFTAINDNAGGVAIKLGIVNVGASSEYKGTSSNTITVNFREYGSTGWQLCTRPEDKGRVCDVNNKPIDEEFSLGWHG
jgi:hypothetical protein